MPKSGFSAFSASKLVILKKKDAKAASELNKNEKKDAGLALNNESKVSRYLLETS